MKHILTILPLTTLIAGCGSRDAKRTGEIANEFEGVITYKISYVDNPDSVGKGDTMWLTYSKGNMAKLYNSMKYSREM